MRESAVLAAMPAAEEIITDLVSENPEAFGVFVALLILAGAIQQFLGPDADWVEDPRQRLLISVQEALTPLRPTGLYVSGEVTADDLGATLQAGPEKAEEVLYRLGFHRNLLAALKYVVSRIGARHYAASSWVLRESLLADKQLHITVFDNGDGTSGLYPHVEWSALRHPVKHYFGDPDEAEGFERLHGLLDGTDVAFEAHNTSAYEEG